jgi:hypothetical protein
MTAPPWAAGPRGERLSPLAVAFEPAQLPLGEVDLGTAPRDQLMGTAAPPSLAL